MSDKSVKKRELVRRRKKYFKRRDIRVYVFTVILSLSIMAIISFVNAVFN